MQAWVEGELKSADFGDERLDARFQIVMDDLSREPSASIPTACGGWNETHATYRFFRSERVDYPHVLQPHREASLKRIAEHPVVLLIQDTTEADHAPAERMEGAGPLNDESRWGFYVHPLYALTPERIPLGIVQAEIWARDLEEFRARQKEKKQDRWAKINRNRQRPIEEKESLRWLEGYRRGCKVAAQIPETTIIVVSDSEADVYECFEEAGRQDGTKKAEWIIRACQDRSVANGAAQRGYGRLREKVASTRVLGTLEVEVREHTPKGASDGKRNQPRTARTATMTIRATRVKLRGPRPPTDVRRTSRCMRSWCSRRIHHRAKTPSSGCC